MTNTEQHQGVVTPDHDWDALPRSLSSAIEAAVNRVPEDAASIMLGNPHVDRIAREVSEDLRLDIDQLGPHALYFGEMLLQDAGLTPSRLSLGKRVLEMLYAASGPARVERMTIRQVMRNTTPALRVSSRSSCVSVNVTRPRARGARPTRARALARNSSRSGDSGDDGPGEPSPSDLPAPQRTERVCQICGVDISHRRADALTCKTDKCKKRRQRANDGSTRRDPYLELSETEHDWQRSNVARCRCNGHHLLDGDDGNCIKCGLPYRDDVAPYYIRVWEDATNKRSPISSHLASMVAA